MTNGKSNRKRWQIIISLIFIIATNLVFLRLFFETPVQHRYTGVGFEAAADKFVYYSMIEQGRLGRLFMSNNHTSEPQRGLLFSPHWLAIGLSADLLHSTQAFSYHLYRIMLTVFFLVAFYFLIVKLFSRDLDRVVAFASTLFVSGMGWLYYLTHPVIGSNSVHWLQNFNRTPVDLYVTEMSPFTNTIQAPLFILSHLLIIVILYGYVQYAHRGWKFDAVLFFETLLLLMIHPYDAIVLGLTIGGWSLWRMQQQRTLFLLRRLAIIIVAFACALFYHWFVFVNEPALAGWLRQNIAFSPSARMYLWGFGVTFPFAVAGAFFMLKNKERNEWWWLMLFWSMSGVLSLYLPLTVNRRFANALIIPLSLLGYYGFTHLLRRIPGYTVQTTLVVVFGLCAFSGTLYRTAQYLLYQPTLEEKYVYYLDPYVQNALRVADLTIHPDERLVSNEEFISILFGAYTHATLYTGHAHQTVQSELKKQTVQWFFSESETVTARARKEQFLRDNQIGYIVVYKPSLTTDYSWLTSAEFVTSIFSNEAFTILRVNPLSVLSLLFYET